MDGNVATLKESDHYLLSILILVISQDAAISHTLFHINVLLPLNIVQYLNTLDLDLLQPRVRRLSSRARVRVCVCVNVVYNTEL